MSMLLQTPQTVTSRSQIRLIVEKQDKFEKDYFFHKYTKEIFH